MPSQHPSAPRCAIRFAVAFAFAVLCLVSGAQTATTHVVISQIYGGGGNTGAPYNADYVELYNPTSAAVSLTGWSVQYASSTGTSYQVGALPSGATIQPGHFFLVQTYLTTTTPAVGAALPTPDASVVNASNQTINLSATTGKVALVSNTNALVGATPCTGGAIVDFVGFGTASCSQGTGPAVAGSNILAVTLSFPCASTGNNATDYAAVAPNPRNAATVFSCSSTGVSLSASAAASPSSVNLGSTSLLTVTVTPATLGGIPSTGITVAGNLSAIGGSTSTAFHDDGLNGDVTAGDNIFSWTATVPSGATTGALSLPITVGDAQLRSATASIALTLVTPPPVVAIGTLQAAKPSAYVGQTITTSGIVVGIRSNGFFLELRNPDAAATTPQGVFVFSSSAAKPSLVALGNEVQVSGTVATYSAVPSTTPDTELTSPSGYVLLNSGTTLPAPVHLTAAMASPTGGLSQLARYEGMRVQVDALTTTSGTDAYLTETTETNVSNGQFFGIFPGTARPFREPGISLGEPTLPTGTPSTVTRWDGNPEVIGVDTAALGGAAVDVTSTQTVSGLQGVLDFSNGSPTLLQERATAVTVTGTPLAAQGVAAGAAGEVTVASFNMERFYNATADSAGTSDINEVVVTPAAYQRRLAKGSLAIRNVLGTPDILGVQEIENIAVLNDLSAKISTDALAAGQTDPQYAACLVQGNDIGGINVGFLVKSPKATISRCEQFGKADTFTNAGGSQAVLNDRPPLVLHAVVRRTGLPDYPLTVISNHLRSLISIDDVTNTGITVRLKREAQAEYLARLIQGYQAAGEHVISVGDYNAFEFSDGYVDSIGVIKGAPVPASQVAQPPLPGLVNPALTDLVTLLPAAQRQSYVQVGNAQVLDHVLVTSDLVTTGARVAYAHFDADFPLTLLNDATRPERVSDHDPAVAYFTLPAPAISLSASTVAFGTQLINTGATARTITVSNTGNVTLNVASYVITGSANFTVDSSGCGASLSPGSSCTLSFGYTPSAVGAASGGLSFVTNAGTSTVTLTGTGGDFSVASTPVSATVAAGSPTTFAVNITSLGSYTGSVTLACAGAILGESCTVSPASATLPAAGSVPFTVVVTTTARTLARTGGTPADLGGTPLAFGGIGLATLLGSFRLRRRCGPTWRALAGCLLLASLALAGGCGGKSAPAPNPNGTPAGTQSLTLTATSGSATRTATVTLTVQ